MILRRIAATAAVALGSLAAVPGVAMASTGGSAPPVVEFHCPKVVKAHGPAVQLACCAAKAVKKHGGTPAVVAACCPGAVVTRHGKVTSVKVASCCPNVVLSKRGGGGPVLRVACCARLIRVGSAPGQVVPVPSPSPSPGPFLFPVTAACGLGQPMTFDMPAYSSTATEVSGPRLTAHELVIYQRHTFMIRSVNGRSFTLDQLPGLVKKPGPVFTFTLFTNGATAIIDGHAVVLRGLAAITVSIKRVPLSQRRRYQDGGIKERAHRAGQARRGEHVRVHVPGHDHQPRGRPG
jgi:hypothetical protein